MKKTCTSHLKILTGVTSISFSLRQVVSLSFQQALVNVSKGDFETASRFVCASFACSIGGVILFALTCAVLVISFVAYIRMVYLSE